MRRVLGCALGMLLAVAGLTAVEVRSPSPARAAAAPLPQTVSADALPTVQINGVVWDQVIVGNTVYVAGEFTRARPAGAAPGQNETVRNNMLAYNINTGELVTSFNPNVNAQVQNLAVTPDKTKLVAVGPFTKVGGQTRNRIAVFNLPSGNLSSTVIPDANGVVNSVAATNSTIFVGGYFSAINNVARARVAAINASTGATRTGFNATIGDNQVQAIVVAPDESSIVIGGNFTSVSGSSSPGYGLARLNASTGASMALPVNSEVRNGGTDAGILDLDSDGTNFYGVGWVYGQTGNTEGYFSAKWSDGSLTNIEDCHGDHYGIAEASGVVYTASHAHYCGNSGGFPQTTPGTNRYLGAWTADSRGTNKSDIYGYPSHPGTPRPEILNWFPPMVPGTYTAAKQAAWDVTANDKYVLVGGEFTKVSSKDQQGLVRFAARSSAPNTRGPRLTSSQWNPSVRSYDPGTARVQWLPNIDWDDSNLRYQVFRGTMDNKVYETTQDARFWEAQSMVFDDDGLTPGSTVRYRVRAIDPYGNQATSDWVDVTVASNSSVDAYARSVLADGATKYWRLDEGGSNVNDKSGTDNTSAGVGVSRSTPGALLNSDDTSSTFNGTSTGSIYSTQPVGGSGPQKFSVEGWFKTSTPGGGKIMGFGNTASGSSGTYDRDLYLDSNSRLSFSLRGGTRKVLQSSQSYNDGQWHYAVGTFSQAQGAALYVDGKVVATDTSLPAVREYVATFRVGGDSTASGLPWFNGSIDEVAYYDRVLSPAAVNRHWVASGRSSTAPNAAPTARFTATTHGRTTNLDATSSSDEDGTVASYAWDLGDGTTASGPTATRTYSAAGTYHVTLTVTDDLGATSSTTKDVVATSAVVAAADSFQRTVAGGWGTADTGGSWSASGKGRRSVGGGTGAVRMAKGNAGWNRLGLSSSDIDGTVDFTLDKRPGRGGVQVAAAARSSAQGEYRFRVAMRPDKKLVLSVAKVVGTRETRLGKARTVPLRSAPGRMMRLRFQVSGGGTATLKATLWRAGAAQPAPQVTRTDSTAKLRGAGGIGLFGQVGARAANAPVTLRFDNLEVTDLS